MNTVPKITEIDISKQARALAWFRRTEYALVLLCGYLATILLLGLAVSFPSADAGTLVSVLIASLIFGFAAYTGWRHFGVIDPAAWRIYRVVFPLLVVFCLFIVVALSVVAPSQEATILVPLSFISGVSIGSVALLGWILLMLLRRMNITAMGVTVDQVLLRLAKNAGVTAVKANDIKRINKPLGLFLGTAGALLLLVGIIPTPDNEKANAVADPRWQSTLLGFLKTNQTRRARHAGYLEQR